MLPDVAGAELLVIAAIALIVVGPKDLPMLMRKVGNAVGRMRAMANEFRASFDEMARQSELDDLRREVEAMRSGHLESGQTAVRPFTAGFSDDEFAALSAPSSADPAPAADKPARKAAVKKTGTKAKAKPAPRSDVTTRPKATPKSAARAKTAAATRKRPS